MIGLNNNYLIYELNEKILNKPGIMDDFEKVDYGIENFDIQTLILRSIDNGGVVYGVKERKVLKAVFIFDLELEKKKKRKKVYKRLVFKNAYFTEDLSRAVPGFAAVIEENLMEKLATKEIDKVYWNGKEIVGKQYVFLDDSIFYLILCIVLGIIAGILLNSLILFLVVGVILGVLIGSVIRVVK